MNYLNSIVQGLSVDNKIADNNYIGYDGIFKSDARVDERENGKSTVANFYVEDGSQVSDHVITDARTLTVSGEISEVTYQETVLSEDYSSYRDEVGNIGIYLPTRTNSQLKVFDQYVNQASNIKRQIEDAYSRTSRFGKYANDVLGNDSLNSMVSTETETKKSIQSEFVAFIREYHQLKRKMKVETHRFGIFENMIITNYVFNGSDNNHMTYTIDMQEIREAQTIVTPISLIAKNTVGKQAKSQTSKKQDKGVAQGSTPTDAASESLATKIKNLF